MKVSGKLESATATFRQILSIKCVLHRQAQRYRIISPNAKWIGNSSELICAKQRFRRYVITQAVWHDKYHKYCEKLLMNLLRIEMKLSILTTGKKKLVDE